MKRVTLTSCHMLLAEVNTVQLQQSAQKQMASGCQENLEG